MKYSALEKLIKRTNYIDNPYAGEEDTHPFFTPQFYPANGSAADEVDVFAEKLLGLNVDDYGDFMRAANSYLCELREKVRDLGSSVARKLDQMQNYTQFAPNWDIETTKARLMYDAKILKKWIQKLEPRIQKNEEVVSLRGRKSSERNYFKTKAS